MGRQGALSSKRKKKCFLLFRQRFYSWIIQLRCWPKCLHFSCHQQGDNFIFVIKQMNNSSYCISCQLLCSNLLPSRGCRNSGSWLFCLYPTMLRTPQHLGTWWGLYISYSPPYNLVKFQVIDTTKKKGQYKLQGETGIETCGVCFMEVC